MRPRFGAPGDIDLEALQTQVTQLLAAVSNGDGFAADRLMRLVYDELHRIAHALMVREDRRGGLQTTLVVNEACLKLMPSNGAALPENRRQLFGYFANAMRQFLVENARNRNRLKRGGGQLPAALSEDPMMLGKDPVEVLAVDEALRELRERDPQKARIVELRYFTGLSVDETAEMLGISARQVDKEWQFARAWLHRALS